MSKSKPKAPVGDLSWYDALIAAVPGVERKGAAMPYTSVNGNMFSMVTPDGSLAMRLGTPEREEFLKRYGTTLCEQHGVVLKEYVRVPTSLLARPTELAAHFAASHRYACSLKPKPTSKSATANKPSAKPRGAKRRPIR